MRGIKNIIFDLGGVILNIDSKRTTDAFVALGLKNVKELFGLGHADSFFKDYEVGKITDRQFINAVREATALDADDQAIVDGWNALLLDFPPERIELLRQLGKNYRIFLFSNTNALHLAALRGIYTRTFGSGSLEDLFEKTYYSHLLGMRKPDRASYEYILRENELNAPETLFVDDAIINVEGAEQAGLKGLYLRPGISLLDFQW
ncbi:HAD family hydrolase [Puia dinghuensis]|uniref:Hydrolase n=1 Tax=Puia dinghuensis TaxID=1792502 RepID=A0A8J2UG29_9BACT|nr:HAD family phosphatase [Puia dinghuensis]GGB11739.1 hydrolase [Puia dinghuensis]